MRLLITGYMIVTCSLLHSSTTPEDLTQIHYHPTEDLTVTEIQEAGAVLILSDGSQWEINPADTNTASAWIIPNPLVISKNGDPKYPYTITNNVTGSFVRAKKKQI